MIPVFVDDPNTWTKIQVPQEIVRICEDFTVLDPYNKENTISEKLRLIDCYWYNMGSVSYTHLTLPTNREV